MSLKKDKQKVLGEIFDEARVRSFLEINARDGINTDFALLERAYRGMKTENFQQFIGFFIDAGHNINATNPEGLNLLQISLQHKASAEYSAILSQAGARS